MMDRGFGWSALAIVLTDPVGLLRHEVARRLADRELGDVAVI